MKAVAIIYLLVQVLLSLCIFGCASQIPANYAPRKIHYYIEDPDSDPAMPKLTAVRENDGSNSTLPTITKEPSPSIPNIASRAGIEADVLVIAIIDKDGSPLKVFIQRSDAEVFNDATLEAVKQWKFSPLRYHGEASIYRAEIPISYQVVNGSLIVVVPE